MIAVRMLVLMLIALSPQAASAQAPAGLQNKSAVVSWTENRTQRYVDNGQTESVGVPYTYQVYFSTAGRPFARLTVANRRGVTAQRERVGTGSKAGDGGVRSLQMRGNSLVATSGHGAGARQIQVTFDGGYASCSANVILGRAGGGKVVMTNLVSGRKMEILSNSTSGATCSLRSGNVFGS